MIFLSFSYLYNPHTSHIFSAIGTALHKTRVKMKTIQMFMICALITSIVTEDKYVVAKLPPGALAKDGKPSNDYWAFPWAQVISS